MIDRPTFKYYTEYLAIRSHFNTKSYDYFKYNGRVNVKEDTFERKNHKYFFLKLKTKYPDFRDYQWFLVANLLNDSLWVGTLLEGEKHDTYLEFNRDRLRMRENMLEQLEKLLHKTKGNYNKVLTKTGTSSILWDQFMENEVNKFSMIAIDCITPYMEKQRKTIDNFILHEYMDRLIGLKPFLQAGINRLVYRESTLALVKSVEDIYR